VSYVFSILDSILKFSGKKSTLSTFHLLGIDTGYGSDPDWHALDAEPDPDPDRAK
jgi:hypothetical protein